MTLLKAQCDDCSIFFFKSDESGSWSGQRFKIFEKFVNDGVLFLDAVELLQGDVIATSSQSVNEVSIVVGEDHIGDSDVLIHLFRLSGLASVKV